MSTDDPGIIKKLRGLAWDAWQWAVFFKKTERMVRPAVEQKTDAIQQAMAAVETDAVEIEKAINRALALAGNIKVKSQEGAQSAKGLKDMLDNLQEVDADTAEHVTAHLATFAMNLPEWIRRDADLSVYWLNEVDIERSFEPALERTELERLGKLRDSINRMYNNVKRAHGKT